MLALYLRVLHTNTHTLVKGQNAIVNHLYAIETFNIRYLYLKQ